MGRLRVCMVAVLFHMAGSRNIGGEIPVNALNDRVASMASLLIELNGLKTALVVAHFNASVPDKPRGRGTFGQAFWQRVVDVLYARERNGGMS